MHKSITNNIPKNWYSRMNRLFANCDGDKKYNESFQLFDKIDSS